jgi:predicted transcriptional regulator
MAQASAVQQHDTRHAIFMQIIDLLWGYEGQDLKDLAEHANVHWTTLYKWQRGGTYAPRLDKIAAVAAVMGYTIVLKRTSTIPTLRRVK